MFYRRQFGRSVSEPPPPRQPGQTAAKPDRLDVLRCYEVKNVQMDFTADGTTLSSHYIRG